MSKRLAFRHLLLLHESHRLLNTAPVFFGSFVMLFVIAGDVATGSAVVRTALCIEQELVSSSQSLPRRKTSPQLQ